MEVVRAGGIVRTEKANVRLAAVVQADGNKCHARDWKDLTVRADRITDPAVPPLSENLRDLTRRPLAARVYPFGELRPETRQLRQRPRRRCSNVSAVGWLRS